MKSSEGFKKKKHTFFSFSVSLRDLHNSSTVELHILK